MPYCGKRTEQKSLADFKEVVTSEFKLDEDHKNDLFQTAARIGGICKSIRHPSEVKGTPDHLSVTSSGEFWHSIRNGGQAQAVRELLLQYMTEIPNEDSIESTPFGDLTRKKGHPIWKTYFREPWELEHVFINLEFGEILEQVFGSVQLAGYDDKLGLQILYCAWRSRSKTPLIRVSTVPESGNKARIVTVSECWLNILFSPFCHLLKAVLMVHPSVFSSFTRADQNWESLRLLMNGDPNPWTLSSDLKDATNAIPFDVAKTLLRGFCMGAGIPVGPYRSTIIDLIGPRFVVTQSGEDFYTSRGIMMGESIAKPILTILNLVVEELACLRHNHVPVSYRGPMPVTFTRAVHIGGDDHVIRGPRSYLKTVTKMHIASGSMISTNKHGISKLMVRYTEKILYVKNFRFKVLFKNLREDELDKTPAIDSVKVRLLTKSQSTLLKKDDRNVAIGKAFQLMRTIRYLGDKPFSKMVRDLFISRMRPLLPSKDKHPKIWHMMFLPQEMGGLSLGLKDEVESHFTLCPFPIKALLWKMSLGVPMRREGRLLKRLVTNPAQRGITYLQERTEILERILEEESVTEEEIKANLPFLEPIQTVTYRELGERFQIWGQDLIRKLRTEGIFSHREFVERYLRGSIFLELLSKTKPKRKVFETTPYLRRYIKIRDELLEGIPNEVTHEVIDRLDFNEVFDQFKLTRVIYVDESQEVRVEREICPGFVDTHKDKLSNMGGVNTPSMMVKRFN
jgi:hypothetical protein